MSDNEQAPAESTAGGTTVTATAETNIVVLVEHRPEIVLLDEKKADLLFAHIEAEVEAFEPDMTTQKGRDACRALAAKVTKAKTAVDKARLALTEDARAKIKIVNESGAKIKERLEALADRARAPLTAWEEAEDARQETCRALLEMMRQAAIVPLGATSETLKLRISEIEAVSMDETLWQGLLDTATATRQTATEALTAALARVEQEEKDRAELARLREEAAAREAQVAREAEERAAAEAERQRQEEEQKAEAERAEREAREAEERAAAEEQEREAAAERQRVAAEQAATAAAEAARQEEAARAAEQAAETQRAHEAELAAERERAAAAEAREAERVAEEQRVARERAAAEANQARRTAAKREAKEALMTTGMSEDHAQKAVLLIIAGEVPRVFLDFAAEPKVKAEPKPEGAML